MKTVKFLLILAAAVMLLTSCDESTTNPNQVATPVISPAAGTYAANQSVTITTATSGATIYYTTNGATPDSSSTVYTAPFVVATTTTVKAIAMKDGSDNSAVASETIVIDYEQSATPVITPANGTYMTAQTITITSSTAGAIIKYTLDGTDPNTTSNTYTAPFQLDHNATVKAIATKDQMDNSGIATATYIIYSNMISVPGGTFTMGRASGTGYDDELPTHSVTISPFYMGKYEVTQAEWFDVMGTNPSSFTGNTSRPVEMVSFYSVLKYCNMRSMQEGLTPVYTINNSTDPGVWGAVPSVNSTTWNAAQMNVNANGYRLPTEAEWEYAARGGTNNPDYLYAGSNTVGDVAWYTSNSGAATHPVGDKAPNGLGFYDMSGNVQEWVWDWYGANYYSSSTSNNPTGPSSGIHHTIRGGAWDDPSGNTRVVFRNWGSPEKGDPKVKNNKLGFRVVRG